jgi:hypothetical protein
LIRVLWCFGLLRGMGQSGGKQQSKQDKGKSEAHAPKGKYAQYVRYWEGETDDWSHPSATQVPLFVPAATGNSGEQFLALLRNKDLCGLVAGRLDAGSRLALRLACRAAAQRIEAMPRGVLDLRVFPVLLQGLKLARCTAPWPVTELLVDQMVLGVPGGFDGLETMLRAHSHTLVRFEMCGAPWANCEVGCSGLVLLRLYFSPCRHWTFLTRIYIPITTNGLNHGLPEGAVYCCCRIRICGTW